MDICLILDTSISVNATEWDELRSFFQDYLTELFDIGQGPADSRVGAVSYSHVASLDAPLTRSVGPNQSFSFVTRATTGRISSSRGVSQMEMT